MSKIDDHNFDQQKALIRVDFNVPLDDRNKVDNDRRIRGSIPTIKKVLSDGGSVILMAHLGRPKGAPQPKLSLKHILYRLEELLGQEVLFAEDCIGESTTKMVKELQPGQVLLLENVRFHPEEKKGDSTFAKKLAQLGDVFINDAFGVAHRPHVSTSKVAQYFTASHKMNGYLIENETQHANRLLQSKERPFTAIVGGAKVSDKIKLLKKLLLSVDNILIGGGMAYTFFKAMDGQIGKSIVEDNRLTVAADLLDKAEKENTNIKLPPDSIIAREINTDVETDVADNKNIPADYMGLDIGPKAIEEFTQIIHDSKKILWNGPMGVFEIPLFENGTRQVGEAVAQATKKGAYSLAGGGDTLSALTKFGLEDKMSFISTGGGALLTYIKGGKLPGLASIDFDTSTA